MHIQYSFKVSGSLDQFKFCFGQNFESIEIYIFFDFEYFETARVHANECILLLIS